MISPTIVSDKTKMNLKRTLGFHPSGNTALDRSRALLKSQLAKLQPNAHMDYAPDLDIADSMQECSVQPISLTKRSMQ